MEPQGGILRAQLARKTGCNLETIRYYEKVELLPAPPRSSNGYRVYSPELVQRLQFILRARDLGFAMEEVRSLLSLADKGEQTCALVMQKTRIHLEDVRRRIAELQRIEAILAATLAECSGKNVPDCPIIDALNRH
ncbi:helix-turn-helix domain-containing protein [Sphingopyxis sp. GW247-27LB]|jgi:MerR family mercuric resistance operon transcriptional regulator|uniref:MerR family transcriptional regulator n=1 Tax=Sphingopyxis sp. GW247-27LB TaxID=2012632 RepID=UPI000BA508D0|nr:helix-turn-helix domain-containing protein [Sphingopyxis sp. GW247-27LB]PAL19842.1 transcriptional regulator [Sphingopyxis sp. GW247-27LB]